MFFLFLSFFCCCWFCSCCWCISFRISACYCCVWSCCSCLPFPSSSSFSLISANLGTLSFWNSMASPVSLLVRFGLFSPSLAPSDALFLPWKSLSIAFILASSALPLSALSLLHVSMGELYSSAVICCIRPSNSLGSSGDIPDALSSALIFFLYLFTKTLMWSRMAMCYICLEHLQFSFKFHCTGETPFCIRSGDFQTLLLWTV